MITSFELPTGLAEVVTACIEHALELLKTAGHALDEGNHHIAYQLAALAIEEYGKADLLQVGTIASRQGNQSSRFQEQTTDHVRKIWWALWGHVAVQVTITRELIEATKGRAKEIDQKRQAASYVDVDPVGFKPPRDRVTETEARELLVLAAEMLKERVQPPRPPRDGDNEARAWFLAASEDPEKRSLIVGQKSLAKLAELGDFRDWMRWLKGTFEEQDRLNRELLQRELTRKPPEGKERFAHKWRLKIRLYSPSHTISRQQPLNSWNDGVEWIKLRRVDRHNDALDVDFYLPAVVSIDSLWNAGYDVSRKFVAALNMSTVGYFWWHRADHLAAYYEKVIDLESDAPLRLERRPALRIGWQQNSLDERALRDTQLVFAVLMRMGELPLALEYYLSGLAVLSKIDVHFRAEQVAFQEFFGALKVGMNHFGEWKEDEEDLTTALGRFFYEIIHDHDEISKLAELGDKVQSQKGRVEGLTLEDVGKTKLLCDVFFVSILRRLARKQIEAAGSDHEELVP